MYAGDGDAMDTWLRSCAAGLYAPEPEPLSFLFFITNASAPRDAIRAAPSAPPTAPPTTTVVFVEHVELLACALGLEVAAAVLGVPVVVADVPAVPLVVAVAVAVVVATSSVPISVVMMAVELLQQLAVLPASRQQYSPTLHWRTFHEATLAPPLQSFDAVPACKPTRYVYESNAHKYNSPSGQIWGQSSDSPVESVQPFM